MKRILLVLMILLLFLNPASARKPDQISAECYVLMEAESGRILKARRADEPRPIASLTKLMTALTVLESGHSLSEPVTIRDEWAGAEGSSIYLKPRETVTLEMLLYGMLLNSGNDAAMAAAGACAGSVPEFVAQMNETADRLGMRHSHFENPNGLHKEGHYSSARDMALLARACLDHEILAKIAATKTISFGSRTFVNHNKLLWRYPGCIGLKTGYTEAAGRTLVSAARRNGITLICVTLNAPNDWEDHALLLNEGFSVCRRRRLAEEGECICRIPVSGSLLPFAEVCTARGVAPVLINDERPEQVLLLRLSVLSAPVPAGTLVGRLIFRTGCRDLGSADLVVSAPIPNNLAG